MAKKNLFFVGILVLMISIVYWLNLWYGSSGGVMEKGIEQVLPKADYEGELVEPKEMDLVVAEEDERVKFSLETVEKHKLINFNLSSDIKGMAYITPSGRLYIRERFCPVCGSDEFIIQNNLLVSEGCYAVYDLESGDKLDGATAHQKELSQIIHYRIEEDKVIINLNQF